MGGLLRDHYDPDTDIILNPFDARSVGWSPFHEAHTSAAFAQIAEVMVPDQPGSNDPFWTKAARLVFQYAARELAKQKQGKATNADLRRAIMNIPAEELAEIIETTPGAHFFGEHVAKTSGGIRANLITELAFLEYLRDDAPPFSIRDWVIEDRPGFVFLTADAEHAAVTRNIISTVLEVAANALMTTEESRDPKVWFFLDEVPTLNRMPFLPKSLAEIRQFGGAFVLGYQVFSQLEEIYGDKAAETISGVLNNRVVLNTPDFDTAQRSSRSLGEEDVVEMNENLTLGAHEARDGVGIVGRRTQRPIVSPAEIQALPQFIGYFRPAYDAPTAKVRFEPVPTQTRAEKLIPYRGPGFDEGGMQVAATNADIEEGGAPEQGFAAKPPEEQRAEFLRWLLRARPEGAAKIEDPALVSERDWYWQHFATARVRGVPATDILPPDPAAGFALNGDAVKPEATTLPYPGAAGAEVAGSAATSPRPEGPGVPSPSAAPGTGRGLKTVPTATGAADTRSIGTKLWKNPAGDVPHGNVSELQQSTGCAGDDVHPLPRDASTVEPQSPDGGSQVPHAPLSMRAHPGFRTVLRERGGPGEAAGGDTASGPVLPGLGLRAPVSGADTPSDERATLPCQPKRFETRGKSDQESHTADEGRGLREEVGSKTTTSSPSLTHLVARQAEDTAVPRVTRTTRYHRRPSAEAAPDGQTGQEHDHAPDSRGCYGDDVTSVGEAPAADPFGLPPLNKEEVVRDGATSSLATEETAASLAGDRSGELKPAGRVDTAGPAPSQRDSEVDDDLSSHECASDNSHPVNGCPSAPERPKTGRLRRLGRSRANSKEGR